MKIKKIYLLTLLFLLFTVEYSRADTSQTDFANTSRMAKNFFDRAENLFNQQHYDSSASYFLKTLEMIDSVQNAALVTRIYLRLSQIEQKSNDNYLALKYARLALKQRTHLNDKHLLAHAYHLTGRIYWHLGQYNQALTYYLQAKSFYTRFNEKEPLSGIYNTIGTIQWSLGNFDLALENYKIALNLSKSLNNVERQARILNNIGLVYQSWKRWEEALSYYKQGLKLSVDSTKHFGYTYSKINIGLISMELGHYDKAFRLLHGAKRYFEQSNDVAGQAFVNKYLGDVSVKAGRIAEGFKYYHVSLNFARQAQNNYRICEALLSIGQNHFRKNEFRRAENYLTQSLSIAKREGYKKITYQIYEILAQLNKAKRQYGKGFYFLNKAIGLKDSLFNEQKLAALSDIQLKLDLDEKERENVLLKNKNLRSEWQLETARMVRIGLSMSILFALILIFLLWHRWNFIRKVNSELEEQNENIKQVNAEKETLIQQLKEALAKISTLQSLLPICSNCKKIRDDEGYWQSVEGYISAHSHVKFSHGLCPDCAQELYPEIFNKKNKK